jgi:hypothetical protein
VVPSRTSRGWREESGPPPAASRLSRRGLRGVQVAPRRRLRDARGARLRPRFRCRRDGARASSRSGAA